MLQCYRQSTSQLPATISTLTLSDNMVTELRDISHLAHLSRLEQLSITDNPCIQQEEEIERQFDYRPYVINWCLGLRVLDGLPVGARESLKVAILRAFKQSCVYFFSNIISTLNNFIFLFKLLKSNTNKTREHMNFNTRQCRHK